MGDAPWSNTIHSPASEEQVLAAYAKADTLEIAEAEQVNSLRQAVAGVSAVVDFMFPEAIDRGVWITPHDAQPFTPRIPQSEVDQLDPVRLVSIRYGPKPAPNGNTPSAGSCPTGHDGSGQVDEWQMRLGYWCRWVDRIGVVANRLSARKQAGAG